MCPNWAEVGLPESRRNGKLFVALMEWYEQFHLKLSKNLNLMVVKIIYFQPSVNQALGTLKTINQFDDSPRIKKVKKMKVYTQNWLLGLMKYLHLLLLFKKKSSVSRKGQVAFVYCKPDFGYSSFLLFCFLLWAGIFTTLAFLPVGTCGTYFICR